MTQRFPELKDPPLPPDSAGGRSDRVGRVGWVDRYDGLILCMYVGLVDATIDNVIIPRSEVQGEVSADVGGGAAAAIAAAVKAISKEGSGGDDDETIIIGVRGVKEDKGGGAGGEEGKEKRKLRTNK